MSSRHAPRIEAWHDRLVAAAFLALPVAILYTRAGSEILIALLDVAFLADCARRSNWAWLRRFWVVAATAWWVWLVICSVPFTLHAGAGPVAAALAGRRWSSCLQALVAVRFLLLAAAAATWLPDRPALRRGLGWMVAAAAAWVALECWQQYLLGRNLFGWPRWGDGALTGPFRQPRAGPALVLILFPAILPPTLALLARPNARPSLKSGLSSGLTPDLHPDLHPNRRPGLNPDLAPRLAAAGLVLFATATMILIGQRMPALLTGVGLIACGVLLPRTRPAVLATIILAAVLLAALPAISPPTFAKLVLKFARQLAHFGSTPYGDILVRATVMTKAHPVLGLGFDGFRHGCDDPAYQHGLRWLGGAPLGPTDRSGCNIHPHNHYLEAATSGGLPGLLLFCATVLAWLATLGRGLLRRPDPQRAALFIAALLALWPLASTSAFFTLPNAGWFFLLLGAGLALAPANQSPPNHSPPSRPPPRRAAIAPPRQSAAKS